MTNETGLTKQDVDRFRQKMLERRKEAVGIIDDIDAELANRGGSPGVADSDLSTHPADTAGDEQGEQNTLALKQHERDLIGLIDEALDRMDSGRFGLCQEDGEPIARERLEAMPWARFCKKHAG